MSEYMGVIFMEEKISSGRLHRLGLSEGGGGVVQIDHGLMTFPAAASVSAMAYILVMLPTARVSFSL